MPSRPVLHIYNRTLIDAVVAIVDGVVDAIVGDVVVIDEAVISVVIDVVVGEAPYKCMCSRHAS